MFGSVITSEDRPGCTVGAGAGGSGLADAVAGVEAALDRLAAVALEAEDDRVVLAAVEEQERLSSRLVAQQVRTLGHVSRTGAHGLDGAVTLNAWYRHRTRVDVGEATRRMKVVARLDRFPALAEAFAAGNVTPAHVAAVTTAATPSRMDAMADHDDTLTALAVQAFPREVRIAVQRIADHVDADGSDAEELPECGPDPRRHLDVWAGVDGLGEIRGTLDQVAAEYLLTALDALTVPDPPDTPATQRRTPGQRRADALGQLAKRVLDRGLTPTVQGVKPHLLLTTDLAGLLTDDTATPTRSGAAAVTGGRRNGRRHPGQTDGRSGETGDGRTGRVDLSDLLDPDRAAADTVRRPRLRWTGPIDPRRARQIALDDAKVTAVLTMGPWRVTNVGRTMRTLPPWLRGMLEMVHRHCRGPDCDRPFAWTESHHQLAWDDGGQTALDETIPLCTAHHGLVTARRWTVTLDPETGRCTWTGPDGTTRTTRPPPP